VANSKALAEHKNPQLLVMKPSRFQSRLPIWKARLRSLYPGLTRPLKSSQATTAP
jgi:hypothetical protein